MRDDIVIRPSLKMPPQASTRAIDDRTLRAQARTRERGNLARLARLRVAQKLARARKARAIARRSRAASIAGRAAAGAGGAGRLGALFGGPVRLGIAAILATKLVRWRLNEDAPYEVLTNRLVDQFTGDLPQQALAQRDARDAVLGNSRFARIIAQNGAVPDDIARVYADHYDRALQQRKGEELFELDATFHRNSKVDAAILWAFKGGYHVPEGVR